MEKQTTLGTCVSDQPRVAAVPVKRDLEKEKGEGVPLVDRDD